MVTKKNSWSDCQGQTKVDHLFHSNPFHRHNHSSKNFSLHHTTPNHEEYKETHCLMIWRNSPIDKLFYVYIVIPEPSPIASLEKSSKRLQRCDVFIVISEPSPIASLEKSSKRVQRCDVLFVISEPSPIASLEKSSKRIQRCDVLIVISEPSPIATLKKSSKWVQRCGVVMISFQQIIHFNRQLLMNVAKSALN